MKEEKFLEAEAELEAMVVEEEEIQRLLQNFECYLNLAIQKVLYEKARLEEKRT